MIKPFKISKVEQAKNLLYLFKGYVFINSSGLPFLFLFLNSISYAIFCKYLMGYSEPYWLTVLDLCLRQICDLGLLGLIALLLINYKWKPTTWYAYFSLCAIWVVNTVYQFILPFTKDYNTNANYFCYCLMIIYLSFFILSMVKLIKRK